MECGQAAPANAVDIRAPDTAMRTSHISVCTRPNPAQAPLMAATMGLGTVIGYQSGCSIVAASGLKSPVCV